MAKGFSISDILGNQSAPAGKTMRVVMLPAADIEPNPDNSIYEIGDVSMLKADIADRGLRSPLEVLPAKGGKYMLIAGHRRWTACRELTADGADGFDLLPCVIRESHGADDDLIALITSNATARELTDGERLRQYKALKDALERKKAAGELAGRVRDEMSRITGDGTGTLGRLNAIINNCTPEVLKSIENGEVSMTRAYECSKLYKVQQMDYIKKGYATMPVIGNDVKQDVVEYIVKQGLADQLKKLDYVRKHDWNYAEDINYGKFEPAVIRCGSAMVRVMAKDNQWITAEQLDPADTTQVLAKSPIHPSDYYAMAKKLYADPEEIKKAKEEAKACKDRQQAHKDELEKWQTLAQQDLAGFDSWPLVARLKELGLTIRSRDMADGGKMYVAVDEAQRQDGAKGLPYKSCFVCRYGADGQRVGRDGRDQAAPWYQTTWLDDYIAEDLRRAEK